jgi:hypothetical protein
VPREVPLIATGGNATGIDADASRTSRSGRACPVDSRLPRSLTISARAVSRLTVVTRSAMPLASTVAGSTFAAMRLTSGAGSNSAFALLARIAASTSRPMSITVVTTG